MNTQYWWKDFVYMTLKWGTCVIRPRVQSWISWYQKGKKVKQLGFQLYKQLSSGQWHLMDSNTDLKKILILLSTCSSLKRATQMTKKDIFQLYCLHGTCKAFLSSILWQCKLASINFPTHISARTYIHI